MPTSAQCGPLAARRCWRCGSGTDGLAIRPRPWCAPWRIGVLVLGFLPGYWQEEGYHGGRRFALLSWLPENWRMPVALLLAFSCAVVAVLRSSGNRCC